MTRKQVFILLITIVALASFFRLWNLTSTPPALYSDEAINGNNALEASETGEYKTFYPENNGREGLYINIMAFFLKVFGNESWALRLPSVIFGILTVLGLFLLTKELFKKESVALFASFFLAASFWHINFSRIGFRAIMAPAFLVWSVWLLWKTLENEAPRFTWKLGLKTGIAGILFGLGFHSYIAYRVAPLLLIIPFIIFLKKKKAKLFLLFLLGAVLAALPLVIYFQDNPQDIFGRTSQVSVFASQGPILNLIKNAFITIQMFVFVGDFNWRHNFAGSPQLWFPVTLLFVAGLIISVKRIFSKQASFRAAYLFLLLWFIFMLLPVFISNEGIPHSLRAIIVAPVVMIFAALGLETLLKRIRNKKAIPIIIIVLVLTISIQVYDKYFIKWANHPKVAESFNQDLTDIANKLNNLPQNTPKYIIIRGADRFDFRGSHMSSQPIMFITKTFLPKWQEEKNFFYVPESQANNIPKNAEVVWIN